MIGLDAGQRARLREAITVALRSRGRLACIEPNDAIDILATIDALERRLAATERVAVRWSLLRKRDDPERVLDALREWVDAELAKEAGGG